MRSRRGSGRGNSKPIERVEFRNGRGLRLVGDLRSRGRAAVVITHGFTGDRHEDGRLDTAAEALASDGFTELSRAAVVRGADDVFVRQLPTFVRHTRRWLRRHLAEV